MYWCGFNGFNQLSNKLDTNLDFHIYSNKRINEEIQQVAFSWSTASILTSIKINKKNSYFYRNLMNAMYIIIYFRYR